MECSICFEPYGLLTKVPCITTCSHTYCNDCCTKMFKAESKVRCICPLCRSDVKSFRFDPMLLEKVYKEIKESEMRKVIMGTCLQCEKGLEV
ncbi:unnamed protein product [Auanema sp. JU1783]|nr:unnamed protein product [Auanema sp. JU1783]